MSCVSLWYLSILEKVEQLFNDHGFVFSTASRHKNFTEVISSFNFNVRSSVSVVLPLLLWYIAMDSLSWKSLKSILPPNGTLWQNMSIVMRHSALPFIKNLSDCTDGNPWQSDMCLIHVCTSSLNQHLGSAIKVTSQLVLVETEEF